MTGSGKTRRGTGWAALVLAGLAWLAAPAAHAVESVVNVYNWGNSIGKRTIADFEKATGIKVVYQEFDSNETLQVKLLSGNAGYDVVVPSDSFWARQVRVGLFRKIDKTRLSNVKLLDPAFMRILANEDPGNQYGLPWSWGTDGLGLNVEKVRAALGPDVALDTWALLFDPAQAAKLKQCGISMLDAPADVFGSALIYLKKDPNSTDPADYEAAYELLARVRPYIRQFNSSSYINDLAGGDICVALGWSGDVNAARIAAVNARAPYRIAYSIPKEGSILWFDMLAIPKDAPHPDAAHAFIDFVLSEQQSANLTNDTSFPSAVPSSRKWVRAGVMADPAVFPSADTIQRLRLNKPIPPDLMRLMNRLWTKLKRG
jgi:putrescine transport system substrate-binding protein